MISQCATKAITTIVTQQFSALWLFGVIISRGQYYCCKL